MRRSKALLVIATLICLPIVLRAGSRPLQAQGDKDAASAHISANQIVAHLANQVLNIWIGEQNSDRWEYQYQPGSWGESCWREHFAVYSGSTGTIESEDFVIDTPFTDPGGAPGSATAVLHSGSVQVTRRVTLPPGSARYFQIIYTVKSAGSVSLQDVRFFETIDFDIPVTGDHTDDYGWYDAATDYVGVRDDEYFRNGIASNVRSTRHGIDYFRTEIYDDWDDGELNNANSYGPGDPAVGKQFNLGDMAPGQARQLILTIWSGDPTVVQEPRIAQVALTDYRQKHHTADYLDLNVLRRALWFSVRVSLEGDYDEAYHDVRWTLKGPDGHTFYATLWTPAVDTSTTWSFKQSEAAGYYKDAEVWIPTDAPIGKYSLTAELYKNDGSGTIVLDSKAVGDFYVIFNPWNDDGDTVFDDDVYNPAFSDAELEHYVLGYADGTAGPNSQKGMGFNYHPNGNEVEWIINPPAEAGNLLSVALEDVSGTSSADSAMEALVDKARWSSGGDPGDIIRGKWGLGLYRVDWRNAPNIVRAWSESENKHPTGQCMDFGGIVNAFARVVGIPSRMLTTLGSYDPHNNTVWNFHVWDQVWINSVTSTDWAEADGTYDVGPATKDNSFIQEEVSTSSEVYTYDAASDSRVNIRSQYSSGAIPMLPDSRDLSAIDTLNLDIQTDSVQYDYGRDVVITVSTENTSDAAVTTELAVSVKAVLYNGLYDVTTFEPRTINVAAASTEVTTYLLTRDQYATNGDYRAIAVAGMGSTSTEFVIDDGFAMALTAPASADLNQDFDVTFVITNLVSTVVSDIAVEVHFPSGAGVPNNPESLLIASLAPGQAFVRTWTISASRPGWQMLQAWGASDGAGYDRVDTGVTILSGPEIVLGLDDMNPVAANGPTIVAGTVANVGNKTATNVHVTLALPPGLTTSEPLVQLLGDVLPGQEVPFSWAVTALQEGNQAVSVQASWSSAAGVAAQSLIGTTEATELVSVYSYEHDVSVSADPASVAITEPSTVTLTIYNSGSLPDSVLLEAWASSPDIAFTVYDGDTPIIRGPVGIPAHGSHSLIMHVTPRGQSTGIILVSVISELDPTAADSTTVNVLPGPDIEVIPPSLELTLAEGQTATQPLTIRNTGGGLLTFAISETAGSSASGQAQLTVGLSPIGPDGAAHPAAAVQISPAEITITILSTNELTPTVAFNSQRGEYLVVWQDPILDANLYAQRVSSVGQLLGGRISVCTAALRQQNPAVAYNTQRDEYLIVWQNSTGDNPNLHDSYIHGQRLSWDGQLQGSVITVTQVPNWHVLPDVAYNSQDDQYLVVWENGTPNILGRRVSGSGTTLGTEQVICGADRWQTNARVVYNLHLNNYFVTWADYRTNGSWDIWGRFVAADGTPGNEIAVSTLTGSDQENPDVAFDTGSNEYMVVWTDNRSGNNDLYRQRISESGTLLGGNVALVTADDGQITPAIAFRPTLGEHLLVWRHGTSGDIRAWRLSTTGSLLGSEMIVCNAPGNQVHPVLAAHTTAAGYLIVWQDSRSSSSDIYASVEPVAPAPPDVPWLSESPISGTVAAGSSATVNVTFQTTGLALGNYTASLTIANNDPDENPVTVPVTLHVGAGPDIAVTPFLDIALAEGEVVEQPLTIWNGGDMSLNFAIQEDRGTSGLAVSLALPQSHAAGVAEDKTAAAGRQSPPVALASAGGPDGFGYTYRDSREPDGPVFHWLEIAPPAGGTGVEIAALTGQDDSHFWPVPLPFAFNFYGTSYMTVAVSSNGAIYFENAAFGYTNASIPGPSNSAVQQYIAPLWDDLLVQPGAIYYLAQPDRVIIEFYRVSGCCSSPQDATWQAILFANGNILFQYKDVIFGDARDLGGEATVGIQGDETTGLLYSYNTAALTDSLAICITYPGQAGCTQDVPWLSESPSSGSVAAYGEIEVTVRLDATQLSVGTHRADLIVSSNDADENPVTVPVTVHVVPAMLAPWPMFRHDPMHTARSPYEGPATNNVRWRFQTGGAVSSSPAVAADGTIYVGSDDGHLYAINPNGTRQWRYPTGGPVHSSPAIAPNGVIYIGSQDGYLYALNPDGSLKWRRATVGPVRSSPVIAADGTIYVGADCIAGYDDDGWPIPCSEQPRLYAFYPDGTLRSWYGVSTLPPRLEVYSSPAIGADGTVYVGTPSGELLAIKPDGSIGWRTWMVSTHLLSSPAVAADGYIWVGCEYKGCLIRFWPDGAGADCLGNVRYGADVTSSPAIGADGTIYYGVDSTATGWPGPAGYLAALAPNATSYDYPTWVYSTDGPVNSSPAIDANGAIYFGSDDGRIHAVDRDGNPRWDLLTGGAVSSSPAIGADGTVYVGSADGYLYAINQPLLPVVQVTTDPENDYDPSLVQAVDGKLCVVWYSERSGRDLWYKTSNDGGVTWSADTQLTTHPWDDTEPAIAQTADGTLWVVWSSYSSGNWDIWYKTTSDGGSTWSAHTQLTTYTGADHSPAIGQTADGRLWVVWYSYRSGNYDLWCKTSSDGGATWSADTRLTTHTEADYSPAIAQGADGKLWVVWYSYRSGNADLWYKTTSDDGSTWSAEQQLTTHSDDDYAPSIVRAQDGVLWLMWYRYISYGSQLWYKTSSNNGVTWSAERQWTRFSGYDLQPDLAALRDGTVAVAWCSDRAVNYDIWFGILGQREDINPPPHVGTAYHLPGPNPDSNDWVDVRAQVVDDTGLPSVSLLWRVNGVPQTDLAMSTDGPIEGGWWSTPIGPFPAGTQVEYLVRATDNDGNSVISPASPVSFTVLEPFQANADILLVPDQGTGRDTAWLSSYYAQALGDGGWAYDLWDVNQRGAPTAAVLNQYLDGVVVWASPEWNSCLSDYYQYCNRTDILNALRAYLDAGGRLFLSGQDIGIRIGPESFYRDYLHAQYVQDDTDLYALTGVPGDPIGNGLTVNISGGDGANNQNWPSEINPIAPAVAVLHYNTLSSTAVAEPPRRDETEPRAPDRLPHPTSSPCRDCEPREEQRTERQSQAEAAGIISSGTAALRVDTGTYKVVYFAFGFEGINARADRALVMDRVLNWLGLHQLHATMAIQPPNRTVYACGGPFTMDVALQDVANLGGFEFTLTFDPQIVHVSHITLASFITTSGRGFTALPAQIDNTAGTASFLALSFGPQPGPTGSGPIATVTFLPQQAGTTALALQEVQMTDVGGQAISTSTEPGSLTILAALPGDMDCDCDVDVVDIMLVASRWRARVGDPNYNARYDLDSDGDIDLLDIMFVAARWADACSASTTISRPSRPLSEARPETSSSALAVQIAPRDGGIQPGDVFTLDIEASGARDLGGFECTLTFDPQALQVEKVDLGNFLGSSGRSVTALGPQIDNDQGTVHLGAFSFGNEAGPGGRGTLAHVTLRALRAGGGNLTISHLQLTDTAGRLALSGPLRDD